jgi:hypothetical protein
MLLCSFKGTIKVLDTDTVSLKEMARRIRVDVSYEEINKKHTPSWVAFRKVWLGFEAPEAGFCSTQLESINSIRISNHFSFSLRYTS